MNKILIFGNGFIGNRLQQTLCCSLTSKRIKTMEDIGKEVLKYNPTIIINAIGYTGKNSVDDCEQNEKTLHSNAFVPMIMAEFAIRNNIKLIHISSGCIYNYDYEKNIPLTEMDIPDFYDLYYSRSKVYSERALDYLSKKYNILILRIRIPLDNVPHSRNLLNKLIKYKKVIDIENSITYIPDFQKAVEHLIDKDARGIYNVVNKGGLKYPELLYVYKKYVPEFEYSIIDVKELKTPRTNLILSTEKLEASGFKVRTIREVLEECVKIYLTY